MSCQNITPREDFQRQLEELNPDATVAIKRMVEAELLLKKRRGPLHPSAEEEIRQAAEVSYIAATNFKCPACNCDSCINRSSTEGMRITAVLLVSPVMLPSLLPSSPFEGQSGLLCMHMSACR